jgi:hypothetical protein
VADLGRAAKNGQQGKRTMLLTWRFGEYVRARDAEDDPRYLDDGRAAKPAPAARCRGCGVLTHVLRNGNALHELKAQHAEGCEQPPSRLAAVMRRLKFLRR